MNCQSIVKKIAEIHSLLLSINPHIVIGTESWIKLEIQPSEIFPLDYITYRDDRIDTMGGGVFILVASHLISCELDEFQCPNSKVLWVQIEQKGSTNTTIGGFYKSPQTDKEYLESFSSTVIWPAAKDAATALSEKISQKADHIDIHPLWDKFHTGMEDLIKAHAQVK